MGSLPALSVLDRASVSVARERTRAVASEVGFPRAQIEELALLVSELAQNQLDHARGSGLVTIGAVERDGVPGLEIVATDRGPGIASPADAVAGLVVPRGLGAGLPSVRRLATELDLEVVRGEGTEIRVRRFVREVRRQPEVAVVARGKEVPCGDRGWFRRGADGLVMAVIDGVGHGREARLAADRAVAALSASAGSEPVELLRAVDLACRDSRGVAASVAWWRPELDAIEVAGVGNVSVRLFSPGQPERALLPTPGVLGARSPSRWSAARSFPVAGRVALVLHTDGLAARSLTDRGDESLFRSPIRVADHLVEQHGKDHDDVLVLVAR